MFRKIIDSPALKLLVGIILLYTSGNEVWREFHESEGVVVGAHHGIFIFAVMHILKVLPEVMEGVDHIHQSQSDG